MNAAQAFAKKHGLDAALAVIREVGGAARVGEVKPENRAATYARLTQ
jgi:hypothetical protein